ncbi:MAG: tryptophan--tRNA ligase [Deltaproteobacteria bacterium]|nr:tryptophan--tRNA ligase [Deltaproteobacteria bacterium]
MTTDLQRVFSGIQPSGDIHIGNYLGAVKKWVELSKTHDCLYCVVDDHAITVDFDPVVLSQRTFNAVLTTMACGLDPDDCTIFVQSHVPEHTELTWLFNTITPMGSLFRMTQFKDKARNALQRALDKKQGGARKTALFGLKKIGDTVYKLSEKMNGSLSNINPSEKFTPLMLEEMQKEVMKVNDYMGKILQQLQVGLGVADASCALFDYPVLQAADILLYKASIVPVGEDQEQHLELCREIADRFNKKFGETFPMVSRIKGDAPRILGLDGKNKMSKSLNNYIGILDSKEEIVNRLKSAFTDPARIKRDDPGHPELCNIFSYHKLFGKISDIEEISAECQKGTISCFDCKARLAVTINETLEPIRDRADELGRNPSLVIDALDKGRVRAGNIAKETMIEVKDLMGIGVNSLNKL